MSTDNTITIGCDTHFKVYINTLLHLSVPRADLVAMQSWLDKGMFFIEYYCIHNGTPYTVLSEYYDRDTWAQVLYLIKTNNIFI